MGISVNVHLHRDDKPPISTDTVQDYAGRPVPVLRIGDVVIFPTVEQLRAIHRRAASWLEDFEAVIVASETVDLALVVEHDNAPETKELVAVDLVRIAN